MNETSLAPPLEKPRYFRIADTTSFLAKHAASGMWLGISTVDLDNSEVQAVFEREDSELTEAALKRGFVGYWLPEDWMRRVAGYEAAFADYQAGSYPWDTWQTLAIKRGVPEDLAALGREVMREAINHGWCDTLQHECGVPLERFGLETYGEEPPGNGMILRALDDPDRYRARWRWLLETDGLRRHGEHEFPPHHPEWMVLWTSWEDENFPIGDSTSEAAFRREAYRYITEFHELDQLAEIDLYDFAFIQTVDGPLLYASYFVGECVWLESTATLAFYPRNRHRGLVRIRTAPAGSGYPFDSELYLHREEQ